MSGGPNEVWSYGDEVYAILADILRLRERIKPYVLEQMAAATERGTPPMRPLWFDFPADARAWDIEDEYLFGPCVLVAPVTEFGARSRHLYLPEGGSGPTRTAVRCTVVANGSRSPPRFNAYPCSSEMER